MKVIAWTLIIINVITSIIIYFSIQKNETNAESASSLNEFIIAILNMLICIQLLKL